MASGRRNCCTSSCLTCSTAVSNAAVQRIELAPRKSASCSRGTFPSWKAFSVITRSCACTWSSTACSTARSSPTANPPNRMSPSSVASIGVSPKNPATRRPSFTANSKTYSGATADTFDSTSCAVRSDTCCCLCCTSCCPSCGSSSKTSAPLQS
ncbi:hypothetical protein IWX49DRAFT_560701 [Phyllosticta citricarpa]